MPLIRFALCLVLRPVLRAAYASRLAFRSALCLSYRSCVSLCVSPCVSPFVLSLRFASPMLVRERWHLIWAPFRLACRSLCRAAHLVSFFYIPSRPASCLASRFASRLVRLALVYRLCVPSLRLVHAVSLLVLASCLGVSFCVSTSRLVLRPAFTACCGEAAFDAAPFRLACRSSRLVFYMSFPPCVPPCVPFVVSSRLVFASRVRRLVSSFRLVRPAVRPALRAVLVCLSVGGVGGGTVSPCSPLTIQRHAIPCHAISCHAMP